MITGKGLFIWRVDQVLAQMGINIHQAIQTAQAAGIEHIIIKIADGDDPFPIPNRDPNGQKEKLTQEFIRALQNAGITVWGFSFVYGTRIDMEAQAYRFAERAKQFDIKGLVIDAEASWKTIGSAKSARTLMKTLRAQVGNDVTLALSTFRYPSYHPQFPFDAFMEECDIAMPQVYWVALNNKEGDAVSNLQRTYKEYITRYPNKLIIPTGAAYGESQSDGTYWSATPNQITQFLELAKTMDLPAVNFWSWEHAIYDPKNKKFPKTELWDAIAQFSYRHIEPPMTTKKINIEIQINGQHYHDGVHPQYPQASFFPFAHLGQKMKYAHSVSTPSSVWAAWIPDIVESGAYEVSVWIPAKHATTKQAYYHIHGVIGEREPIIVTVDQSQYFDEWVRLGTYELDANMPYSGQVQLTNHTGEEGKEVGFAGIRWHKKESIVVPNISLADGFDSPVGTRLERQGNQLWPGQWFDFTGYNVLYTLRRERVAPNQYQDVKAFHTGADLNLPKNRDRHAPLFAAASGKVIFADFRRVWGEIIIIRHDPLYAGDDYVYSRYAHMHRVDVKEGDRVERGQQIGLIGEGDPERPFGAHLHFDISHTNILLENPGHWPGLDRDLIERHYLDPKRFIEDNRPKR